MEELFNLIKIIITGMQNDHKLLFRELVYKYAFSSLTFSRLSSAYAIFGKDKFPIQYLTSNDNNITVIYYIKYDIIRIWRVDIRMENEMINIIDKICNYYNLKKEKENEFKDGFKKCIEKRYKLIKETTDMWNFSLTLFSYIYNESQEALLHIFKYDKSENAQVVFMLANR